MDTNRIDIMIAVDRDVDDPAIWGALRLQREELLRAIRRSDAAVACAAAEDFLQEATGDMHRS